jgi:hypothetical protein
MKDITPIDFNDVSNRVYDWNLKVGNDLSKATWQDIFNQNRVNFEECKELYYAISSIEQLFKGNATLEDLEGYNPLVETLDGGVDVGITYTALVEMLESRGLNVSAGAERILKNNDNKVFTDFKEALDEAHKLQEELGEPIVVYTSVVDGVEYYCLKDENGKVRKKTGFVGVDLSDLLECVE